MKYSFQINICKCVYMRFLLLLFVFFISCKKNEQIELNIATFPLGKWRVIDLKSFKKSIVFDTTKVYFVEHQTKNKIIILAEDNRLSGEFIIVNNDNIVVKEVEITDVCCNSDEANQLFHFFSGMIKVIQLENKLILSSKEGDVTLENKKQ